MDKPDYFQFFGLEPKLTLDAGDLESRFYRLSRELHPDRFLRATPAERQRSLEAAAMLNDAYRTLRDPVARAAYLLEREGFEPSKNAPPELLQEVFELSMALEQLRGGDASARPEVETARAHLLALREEADAALARHSQEYDRTASREALAEIRAILDRRKYIDNLVSQVEKDLENWATGGHG
jgi:molecular chaperone HscB